MYARFEVNSLKNDAQIFLSAVAQHQNLGDVVLRRQAIQLMATRGRIHLLATDCPPDYIVALSVPGDSIVYDSRKEWRRNLISAGVRGNAVVVYSPGPQSLTDSAQNLIGESLRLALTCALRAFRNEVIRLGRSFEGQGPVMVCLVRLHTRLLSLSIVRDDRLRLEGRNHHVLPDLAIGYKSREIRLAARPILAVSLRYDRPNDLSLVAKHIHGLAQSLSLEVVVVSLVEFDQERHQILANHLHARHVGCEGDVSRRLADVSEIFSAASIVASDRLHSLVIGLSQGAVPLLIRSGDFSKVRAALDEIGVPAWEIDFDQPATFSPSELRARGDAAAKAFTSALERLSRLTLLLHLRVPG